MRKRTVEIRNRYTVAVQWSGKIDDQGSDSKNLGEAIKAAIKAGDNLRGADLRGAYLQDADLRGAELRGADLQGANLQDADLRGADLRSAELRGADLQGADLQDAYLRGANLQDADLRGADLQGANLWGANLQDADLRSAELRHGMKIKSLRIFAGLYVHICMAIVDESGIPWVRMGCLWHTVEEWDRIGIRESNIREFPNDGSPKSEERVRAFEFVRATAIAMAKACE